MEKGSHMVTLENAIVARYTHAGVHFELLVDPDLALAMRRGKSVSLDDLLAVEIVFSDAKKGSEATEVALEKAFHTTDIREIAPIIVKEGEVQLTTEQRRTLREQMRKEIVEFISRNAINPQTNAPHPPARIENALVEAKVHVDESKDIMEQVNAIIPKLRVLLPISLEKQQIALKVPAVHVAKALNLLHKYSVTKQEWQSDGSLIAVVEVPGGMRQELFDRVNGIAHGEIVIKLLEKK